MKIGTGGLTDAATDSRQRDAGLRETRHAEKQRQVEREGVGRGGRKRSGNREAQIREGLRALSWGRT